MSKVLIIGEKKIEFPVEIREKISFENIIIVLYRNDKELLRYVAAAPHSNMSKSIRNFYR